METQYDYISSDLKRNRVLSEFKWGVGTILFINVLVIINISHGFLTKIRKFHCPNTVVNVYFL